MVARSRQKIFAASLHIFLNLVLNHYKIPDSLRDQLLAIDGKRLKGANFLGHITHVVELFAAEDRCKFSVFTRALLFSNDRFLKMALRVTRSKGTRPRDEVRRKSECTSSRRPQIAKHNHTRRRART
jgi:hypothetical protein